MDQPITQNNLDYLSITSPDSPQNLEIVKREGEKKDKDKPSDVLLFVYMLICETVINSHQSAVIEAKQVQINANAQDNLIRQEQGFGFDVLNSAVLKQQALAEAKVQDPTLFFLMAGMFGSHPTPKAAAAKAKMYSAIEKDVTIIEAVVDRFQMHNNAVSAIRGTFEDKLNVAKQQAQGSETSINTILNQSSQDIQEGGSFMQMLTTLSNQVARI